MAEDDPTMANLVEEGLRDDGFTVDVVTNGTDALIAAMSTEYGAAAIDVMLPGMTGFELCRHLRGQGSTLPVLLITARDAVEDRVFGLDAGADDYLTKPFAFAELSARIRALVRRESTSPRSVVRVGRVSLDTATVRATVDSAPLTMSTKEFSLLRFLAVNAGHTVSRSQILEEVWGTTKHIDPTVVDQYVSYLRKKLDPVAPGFTIATTRGVGYALRITADS